jgi:hypothetical protein
LGCTVAAFAENFVPHCPDMVDGVGFPVVLHLDASRGDRFESDKVVGTDFDIRADTVGLDDCVEAAVVEVHLRTADCFGNLEIVGSDKYHDSSLSSTEAVVGEVERHMAV